MDEDTHIARLRAIRLPVRDGHKEPALLNSAAQGRERREASLAWTGKRRQLEPIERKFDVCAFMQEQRHAPEEKKRKRQARPGGAQLAPVGIDRMARISIATNLGLAQDSLPLRFLMEHGQSVQDTLRRRFQRVFILVQKVFTYRLRKAFKRWQTVYRNLISHDFLGFALHKIRLEAAQLLFDTAFKRVYTFILKRTLKKWNKTTKRIRRALHKKYLNRHAIKIQRLARKFLRKQRIISARIRKAHVVAARKRLEHLNEKHGEKQRILAKKRLETFLKSKCTGAHAKFDTSTPEGQERLRRHRTKMNQMLLQRRQDRVHAAVAAASAATLLADLDIVQTAVHKAQCALIASAKVKLAEAEANGTHDNDDDISSEDDTYSDNTSSEDEDFDEEEVENDNENDKENNKDNDGQESLHTYENQDDTNIAKKDPAASLKRRQRKRRKKGRRRQDIDGAENNGKRASRRARKAKKEQISKFVNKENPFQTAAWAFIILMRVQRHGSKWMLARTKVTSALQRQHRLRIRRREIDRAKAEAAVAAAVAALAELYLFALLSKKQKEELRQRNRSAAVLQRVSLKKAARAREKSRLSAVSIQTRWRFKAAKQQAEKKRQQREYERASQAASLKIAWYWFEFKRRRALQLRLEGRNIDIADSKRDNTMLAAFDTTTRAAKSFLRRYAIFNRVRPSLLWYGVHAKSACRSACSSMIARLWRRSTGNTCLALRCTTRHYEIRALAIAKIRFNAAGIIAVAWMAAKERYNKPVRLIARSRLEARLRYELETKAANIIQRAARRALDRKTLIRQCSARRLQMDVTAKARLRIQAANKIRHIWIAFADRKTYKRMLVAHHRKLEEEEEIALQHEAASVLQRNARSFLFRILIQRRFEASRYRLDRERQHRSWVEDARIERNQAEAATEAAVETLNLVKLAAWKMGSDAEGHNYYYNWVTGESSYERPEGWEPSDKDIWIKNFDAKGNVFYFNQLTQESAWFPPCSCCGIEAKKVCFDCGEAHYCDACFTETHDVSAEMQEHKWRGADRDKDELVNGEKHCLLCDSRKATLVCKTCRDAYCSSCFADSHAYGALASHKSVSFEVFRKGWHEVPGRVEGEQTYYFNVTTGENTHEKPEDLMLEDELKEHRRFKQFEQSANEFANKVDELQIEIERLQYEKDTSLFRMQQQQASDHEELEELRELLIRNQMKPNYMKKYRAMLKHPLKFYMDRRDARFRKRQLYRKLLLLNKKEREEAQSQLEGACNRNEVLDLLPTPAVTGRIGSPPLSLQLPSPPASPNSLIVSPPTSVVARTGGDGDDDDFGGRSRAKTVKFVS